MRIAAFEQRDFLGARPSFQLRLAGKRLVHVLVRFPVEQTDHVVARGESIDVMEFVLEDTPVEIATDSDVQSTRQASHDVNAVVASIAHVDMVRDGWCGGL